MFITKTKLEGKLNHQMKKKKGWFPLVLKNCHEASKSNLECVNQYWVNQICSNVFDM
jgi:hypothetical protein